MRLRRFVVLGAATLGVGSAVASAATLSVGSWHIWSGSQTLTKGTCTVPASGITDTMVRENSASSSFGSNATTIVRADAGLREWIFVRADLSSCSLPNTGGADSATLKLVVKTTAAGGRTLTVTPVLSNWDGTLTWTQAQALTYGGSATTTFGTGTTNGATNSVTVTTDVDALIRNSTANYGWRITDLGSTGSGNTTTFNSVEAGTAALRPQLVVNYEK
jgi:hypothetical protein